jgi:hypothetical protein
MTVRMRRQPTVGRIVHYVAYGTPGGEYPVTCRAAIITDPGTGWDLGLAVLNPTGMFFNPQISHSPGDPAADAPGARCATGDRAYPGGTWHWPERID